MKTLLDLLRISSNRFGPCTALKDWSTKGVRSCSYRELEEASRDIAAFLQERGVQKGDRVLLWGPNGVEWVATLFGCLKAGAVVVPFDVRAKEDFLAGVLEQTQAALVIAGVEQRAAFTRQQPEVVPLEGIADACKGRRVCLREVEIGAADIAEIVYTSGTTGTPKGVVLTHGNILSNVQAVSAVVPCTPDYRLLSLLPLSHMFEMTVGLLAPLSGGASITYLDSLQPATIFRAIAEERITCMACVPQVLQLFMSALEREVARKGQEKRWRAAKLLANVLPLSLRRRLFKGVHQSLGGQFQFFVCGGAHLDPRLARTWELLGIQVLQGYGMTEAAPVVTCDSLAERDHRFVGRAIPGVEVRIAADGEILVRGPNLTPGYWRNPEATAEAFTEGWYRTGDIGSLSQQGLVKLLGRKKNVIVLSNGMNVYPEDIEAVLKADPRVVDAVVMGQSDGRKESEVHPVLILKEGARAQEVVRAANARLAPHQQVRAFTLWREPAFPMTHTLKPKRAEIARRIGPGAEKVQAKEVGFSPGFFLVRALLRGLLKLLFRIEVRGAENIPAGGYILVANHLNWIDGFLLLACFPAAPKLYILADEHAILKTWWKRLVVRAIGRVITIDRSHVFGDNGAMRTAYQMLEDGNVLALFPEGRVGEEEGRVSRLQRGVGALCLHSGRPVLPVGLSGVSELYLGKEIAVTIGKAFTPVSFRSSMRQRIDDLTDQVQAALEKTLPPYYEKPVACKPMRWLTTLLS